MSSMVPIDRALDAVEVPGERREYFDDNLSSIEMILVDWPCAIGVRIPFFVPMCKIYDSGIRVEGVGSLWT